MYRQTEDGKKSNEKKNRGQKFSDRIKKLGIMAGATDGKLILVKFSLVWESPKGCDRQRLDKNKKKRRD